MMRNIKLFFLLFFSFLLASQLKSQSKEFDFSKNVDIFFSAFREIQNLYVDSLSSQQLMSYAIEGISDKLDPYTEFIPEENKSDFDFMTTGKYGGIGSLIQKDGEFVRVVEPYRGFPADRAGLKAGDRLLKIDDQDLKGLTVDKVSNLLRGPVSTDFNLVVKKLKTGDTVSLKMTRENIRISSVVFASIITDSIGYIRLTGFTENCTKDFKEAIERMKQTGKLKALIFDLRSNGGGLLGEALKISNVFIPKGIEVVNARGRVKDYDMSYVTSEQPLIPDIPLVILVNNSSASASEIVAGAMQDLDRGVIMGTRTFGKGLVQAVRPLGYDARIKFTTAKYYIPSGRCVQAHNFSSKNEDGSVSFIPDSLKKEFRTKGGRKVFDGGGVNPDIQVKASEYSPISVSLLRKNLFFDYSLEFYKKYETITTPDKFVLTDAQYKDFVKFLSDKDYDYQTNSERLLKQLTEAVKFEKYDDVVKNELELLNQNLKHDKVKDLNVFKKEVSNLLESEIAERYFYQEGRLEIMLRDDNIVREAIDLLHKPAAYKAVLKIE